MSRPVGSKNKDKDAEIAKARLEDKNDEIVSGANIAPANVAANQVTSTMPEVPVKIVDNNSKYKDLESRVHEIECFRNPNAIEGRIRDLGQQIEEIKVQIDKINALLNKAYVTKTEENPRILKASQPGGAAL